MKLTRLQKKIFSLGLFLSVVLLFLLIVLFFLKSFVSLPREILALDEKELREFIEKHPRSIYQKNADQECLLSFAVGEEFNDFKSDELTKILIEYGSPINYFCVQGFSPLGRAIFQNKLRTVQSLISLGADIDLLDQEGRDALDIAKQYEKTKIVDYLESIRQDGYKPSLGGVYQIVATAGAKEVSQLIKNYPDLPLNSLLLCAAGFNPNTEVIQVLYDAGADVNCQDFMERTPITYAVKYNSNLKVLFGLVQLGARVNQVNQEFETPLFEAIRSRVSRDVLEGLLKAGVNPFYRNPNGITPLILAKKENYNLFLKLFDEITKYNYDYTQCGYVAFLAANGSVAQIKEFLFCNPETSIELMLFAAVARQKDIEVVRYLNKVLRKDLNIRDALGRTPLVYAVRQGQPIEFLQELEKLGADIFTIDDEGNNLLAQFVASDFIDIEKLSFLLAKGISSNQLNFEKETALMRYLKHGENLDVIQKLCEVSQSVINTISTENKTALSLAIERQYSEKVLDLLWNNGARLDIIIQEAEQLLFMALRQNVSGNTIKWLLSKGANINEFSYQGKTPLIYAVEREDLSHCALLLEMGADVNLVATNGKTALLQAIENGNIDIVNLLLVNQANPNLAVNNIAPLELAFKNKNYEIATLLFQAGADPNVHFDNNKPLLITLVENHLTKEIVSLLAYGADPEVKGSDGKRALDIAREQNAVEIIEILERFYTSGFKNGSGGIFNNLDHITITDLQSRLQVYLGTLDSLLQAAVSQQVSLSVIQYILEQGADINSFNAMGMSPLMYALAFNSQNEELISYLLAQGADINVKNQEGESILVQAINSHCSEKNLQTIIKKTSLLNEVDLQGRTALQLALQKNSSFEMIQLLINSGADVTSRDFYGRDALVYAVQYSSYPQVVDLLFKDNENRQSAIDFSDYDPALSQVDLLTVAVCANLNPEIIRLLLKRGYSSNALFDNGRTVFSYAAQFCNSLEIFQILMKEMIDINQVDYLGRTPLMFAAGYNPNEEVVNLLILSGADINLLDKHGKNALFYTISYSSSIEKLKILEVYYDLNQILAGECSLSLAIKKNKIMIRELLMAGASVSLDLPNQESLLYLAIKNKVDENLIVSMLAQETFGENERVNFLTTALLLLRYQYYSKNVWQNLIDDNREYLVTLPKVLDLLLLRAAEDLEGYNVVVELLKIGASSNALNSRGESALILAVRAGGFISARELLVAGADVNFISRRGETPLSVALENVNSDEIVNLLLANEADPNLLFKKNEISPLEYAVNLGYEHKALLLLKFGANINQVHFKEKFIEQIKAKEMIYLQEKIDDFKATAYQNWVFPLMIQKKQGETLSQQIAWLDQQGFSLSQELILTWLVKEIAHSDSILLIEKLLSLWKNKQQTDLFDRSPLFYAIMFSRHQKVVEIVQKYLDIEMKNRQGKSLLSQMVLTEDVETIKKILAYNPNIDTLDTEGNTILQNVILKKRDIEMIYFIIRQGVKINHLNCNHKTALALAVESKQIEVVEALLSYNADIYTPLKNGDSLMHFAVDTKDVEFIKKLINLGIPYDLPNQAGETPLLKATLANDEPMVTTLLIAGANAKIITKDGKSILGEAILHEVSFDIVLTLLAGGAIVNPPPPAISPLILVMTQQAHYGYFEALIQSGVNPMGNASGSEVPLLIAAEKSPVEMVKRLVEVGADVTVRNSQGKSALDLAHLKNKLSTEQYLETLHALNYEVEGSELSITIAHLDLEKVKTILDNTEFIPYNMLLLNAILNQQSEEVIYELIARGADVATISLKNESILTLAIKKQYSLKFISYLLKTKININLIDASGKTALTYAILNDNYSLVELLIQKGADIHHKNKEGKTLLEIAKQKNVQKKILLLLAP